VVHRKSRLDCNFGQFVPETGTWVSGFTRRSCKSYIILADTRQYMSTNRQCPLRYCLSKGGDHSLIASVLHLGRLCHRSSHWTSKRHPGRRAESILVPLSLMRRHRRRDIPIGIQPREHRSGIRRVHMSGSRLRWIVMRVLRILGKRA
jgi:hypothetical protein